MHSSYRSLTIALSLTAVVALAAGCGDDDGDGGTGGSGNTGNTGNTGGGTGNSGNSGGSGNSGNTGGTGNTGNTGGGGGSTGIPSCADYCDGIDTACTADSPQYIDLPGACEAFCAVLTEGTSADVDGDDVTMQLDTRGCRAYHLSAVPMDEALHCPHAGPAGGGQCGNKMESFCASQAALCTAGNRVYANEAACVTDMTDNVVEGGTYDATQTATNTMNCRIYHLTAAAVDPDMHCQHTGGPNADSGNSAACIN